MGIERDYQKRFHGHYLQKQHKGKRKKVISRLLLQISMKQIYLNKHELRFIDSSP